MANATIQFTRTDDYIPVPTGRLQLTLHTLPPAGASLDIVVYAAPLGQDGGFRRIGAASIDNPGDGSAAPQYALPVAPGMGYVLRLSGEARLLLPGYHAMTVGLLLTGASGEPVHDFGSQYVEDTHALIDGLFYVKAP